MNPFLASTKDSSTSPFDATGLGIALNTITGLPSATVQVAKNIGQGFARDIASAGLTFAKPIGGSEELSSSDIKSPFGQELFKSFFGTEPVKPIEDRIAQAELAIKASPFAQKTGLDKVALPLAFGGIMGSEALNFTPVGGLEKNATKALLEETTVEGASKLLTSMNVPEDVAKSFAPHFAEAKTPQAVQDIFDNMKGVIGAKQAAENQVAKGAIPTKVKTEATTLQSQPLQEPIAGGSIDSPPAQPSLPTQEIPSEAVSSPANLPEEASPVNKLIKAIQEAKPIRGEQEKLYTQARAEKIAKVASVQSQASGEKGFYAELGQLKGELPKVDYSSIRNNLSQQDIDSLFNMVKDSPNLDLFEQISARNGLVKMLGGEGGAVPTTGELKLLSQVFPKEMTDALLSQRPMATKLWEGLTDALNVPRSILASFDLSAPLRQGVFMVGRKEFYPAFTKMFQQFGSEGAFQAVQKEIASRPTFRLMKDTHLGLTEMGNTLTDREEQFMSNLAEKIPVAGKVIRASGRAYVGFLNKLRADLFDSFAKDAGNLGIDFNGKTANDAAKFINSATGRGDLGSFNKAVPLLNSVFFSPRLMMSRLNLLNPAFYVQLDPFVRKQAVKSLLSFGGIASTVLSLAKASGAEVGVDPRNADFGKIKVGNTRFDVLGGFQQYIRLASQLLSGKIISSTTGKTLELGVGYKPLTRLDILERFFMGKENPAASFVTDFLQGQDTIGNKFKLSTELINRFVPLIAQDLNDALKEWGAKGIVTAIPATFGVGVQTYGGKNMSASPPASNPFLK